MPSRVRHGCRERVRRRPPGRGDGRSASGSRSSSGDPDAFVGRDLEAGFEELADPVVRRRHPLGRARPRPRHRRSPAAAGRRPSGLQARHTRTSTRTTPRRRPTACFGAETSEVRWFGMWNLERPAGRRTRSGPGSSCAAPPREAAEWITRRHAGPSVRRRHPARPPPLGRDRAAGLLAVALGAAPRRLHAGHAAARSPRACPAAGTRRCVARRPRPRRRS